MEQNKPETKYTKLDYSLKTAKERTKYKKSINKKK